MKKTIEEHADRFSAAAADYDDDQDSEEYRACANLVVEHAAPTEEDVVLDLGTGTGAIALRLAETAKRVVGRDISEGMLERAREKAEKMGIENVEFGEGRFRDPNYDGDVDIVTTNFAMHHLSDEEKREAIAVIADLDPDRFVLGDVMFFGEPNPEEPFYSPEVDDPATVGELADALTDEGFVLTAVERVHDQVGVLVAERFGDVVERSSTAHQMQSGDAGDRIPVEE
ncbi:methylase involved in ubiquinone/menaquinone biosynthesis [Halogeometricum pallidum JCM 14848]|uniref:Methylase involved in ubiquinone/menaquinone biosynthesis n=1 Tax=Halogeometricum pallidum JCM 14848 TaxID=1227487 RepID=M0CVN6_HALPD|nr:class I SAM-dependent methyltransferase [Halogeometricum pallidum]ELZ26698.1 methylase involved in ubiquinone/menaquinone biosynthesis [Halogeometricum pallidum JCM 14848]